MRVMWFTNIMLPEFAKAIGRTPVNIGGWMDALLSSLQKYAPDVELCIVCQNQEGILPIHKSGKVTYMTLGSDPAREAESIVAEFRPDVIHIHGTEGIAQLLPPDVIGDSKTIVSIQGVLSGCFQHYAGGLAPGEISHFRNWSKEILKKTGLFQLETMWREKRVPREKVVFSKVKNLAGRTEWDCAWAKALSPTAKYFTIGEILRQPFYSGMPDAAAPRIPHRIYCSAAMSYPLKGGHWLLRAVGLLKERFPDVQLRVANAQKVLRPDSFIGLLKWGDYERYLNHIIEELGLARNVELLGDLSAEQVADELRSAEVFCLPSHCENSPNSLGEAQLLGVPCVATYVGGVSSMLKDGEDGLLVPSGDPAVLAYAIEKMFVDKAFAKSCAAHSFEKARKRHDQQTVVSQLLSCYDAIKRK